jgi:hypothetical protein
MKHLPKNISNAPLILGGLFILFTLKTQQVYALNTGDACGTYASGPNECVTACQVYNKDTINAYCGNAPGGTGPCTPATASCTISSNGGSLGCWTTGVISGQDCAGRSVADCTSGIKQTNVYKACSSTGGPTPTAAP